MKTLAKGTLARPRFSRNGHRNNGSPHDIDCGIRVEVTMVSPELAAQMLEKIHPRQRGKKTQGITKMLADLEADRFYLTHQGAAFDEDGYLVDGRNRLTAIQRSGKTVPLFLFYGLPRDVLSVIDTGSSRNTNDVGRIMGLDIPNPAYYSVARAMVSTPFVSKKSMSNQEVIDVVTSYRSGLDFVFKYLGKSKMGITSAWLRAVIARAYYSVKADVLVKFCETMYSGLPEDSKRDQAAVVLRNWLLEPYAKKSTRVNNRPGRMLTYGFTEYALDAYIRAIRVTSLQMPSKELFEIPSVQYLAR